MKQASVKDIIARVDARLPKPNRKLHEYLAARIVVNEDGCWIWKGVTSSGGTPIAYVGRDDAREYITVPVRRLMMEAAGIEPDEHARYGAMCGRQDCVNPYHAEEVGRTVNSDEYRMDLELYVQKRKEIAEIEEEMKQLGITSEQIAERYGIRRDTVVEAARRMMK